MRRALGFAAAASLALALAAQSAWAQRPEVQPPVFGHTLHQGSGYITTPHALVPRSSLFVTGVAAAPEATVDDYVVTRIAGGITLAKFLEVGVTAGAVDAFSLFGKLQIVKQRGPFPAMAVGVQQLTTANLGRYGIEDDFYDEWYKSSSFYGVLTYVVGPGRGNILSWVTFSGGWGTGVFLEDNPAFENDNKSGGVFGAVSFDFQAADEAYIRFAGEWDGFDFNVSAVAWLAGLEFTVGALSVGAGEAEVYIPGDPQQGWPGHYYNQVKPYFSVTIDFRALGTIPWVWTGEEE